MCIVPILSVEAEKQGGLGESSIEKHQKKRFALSKFRGDRKV